MAKAPKYERHQIGPVVFERQGRFGVMRNVMTEEQHAEYLDNMRKWAAELKATAIPKAVSELEELLAKYDALETLSQVAAHNLLIDPETYKEYQRSKGPAYVEYLGCLVAKRPYVPSDHPTSENLSQVQELLEKLFRLQVFRFMEPSADVRPSPAEEAQFVSRLSELSIRGPAYQHHLSEMLTELFEPVSDWIEAFLGFTVPDATLFYTVLAALIPARLAERAKVTKQAKSHTRRLLKECRSAGRRRRSEYPPEIVRLAKLGPKRLEKELKRGYLATLGWNLKDVFSFTDAELASSSGLPLGRVRRYLDLMATDFGSVPPDFAEPTATHPLQSHPILRTGATYICPVSDLLLWNLQDILEDQLRNDDKIWERYQRVRARYLENKTLAYFEQIFRHADVYPRLRYVPAAPEDPSEGEIDGLITYDDKLLIVQSKARPLSDPAKRGAQKRIEHDLRRVIVDATEQARMAKRYVEATDDPEFTDERGNVVRIDKDRIREIYLVVTTLGDFDVFASRMHLLKRMGLLKEGDYAWGVYLNDLRIIAEHIEFPAQFIHYLRRRQRLNEQENIFAHGELDWFGHYLLEGLYFDPLPEGQFLQLATYTTGFDDYYLHEMGLRRTRTKKMHQAIPPKIREVIDFLEQERPQGYSDAICLLLESGGDTREQLAQQIGRLTLATERTGDSHDFTGMSTEGSFGLTYMTSGREDRDTFAKRLQVYCAAKKHQLRVDRWLGIGNHVRYSGLVNVIVYLFDPWEPDSDMDEIVASLFGHT